VSGFSELAAALLREGHAIRFRATGRSMRPAIRHGDLLRVEPVDWRTLRPGDVVLFRLGGRLLAHRVVRADGTKLVTRGDRSPREDPPVTADQVLGRVAGTEPGRGRPSNGLSEILGARLRRGRGRVEKALRFGRGIRKQPRQS
jgi:signal peptidase I